MSDKTPIYPKSPRELDQFYREVSKKLAGTDTTLSDEEKKSIVPFNGMISETRRQIESLQRENRSFRAHIIRLETRIKDIEGQL